MVAPRLSALIVFWGTAATLAGCGGPAADGPEVRVVRSWVERPRFFMDVAGQRVDLSGTPEADAIPELLHVELEIANRSVERKLDYKRCEGPECAPSLGDDHGNRYRPWPIVSLGPTIAGHVSGASIYPGQKITDTLLFEVPVRSARELRLTVVGQFGAGTGARNANRTLTQRRNRPMLERSGIR